MNPHTHRTLKAECMALLEAADETVDESARAMIAYFFETDEHLTPADVERYLGDRDLPFDVEQVRRTMRMLVDYGFALERNFADGQSRYEHLHVGEHHDHLYCLRCGSIIEFCSPELEERQLTAAQAKGFHAFSHRLVIRGLCQACFGESASKSISLGNVQRGGRFRVIRGGRGGGPFPGLGRRRLAELGIVAGAEGEVLSNRGPMMVVQIGGTRLALRHQQTRRVLVELLN